MNYEQSTQFFIILNSSFPFKVGLVGLEPTTSPLSEERSNRLSYRPRIIVNCELIIVNY